MDPRQQEIIDAAKEAKAELKKERIFTAINTAKKALDVDKITQAQYEEIVKRIIKNER